MANANWARWVFASLATYLKEEVPVLSVVEGFDERSAEFQQTSDRAEIRITGPFIRELSRGYWELQATANVLLTCRFDGPDVKNRYTFVHLAGLFQEAMQREIPVYRHGNSDGDDGSLLGCLRTLSGRNDAVRVFHFGQMNPTDGVRQTMIDAKYIMEIEEV